MGRTRDSGRRAAPHGSAVRGVTPADTIALKSFHSTMNGSFPLVVMTLEQENLAPHDHDFVELVYVEHGSAMHIHGTRRYPIFAGDCFVVMPGESHGYDSRDALRITNVLFFPRILRHYETDLASMRGFTRFFTIEPLFRGESSFRHKLHLGPTDQRLVTQAVRTLARELDQRAEGYRSLCTALLLQLVVTVARLYDTMTGGARVSGEFERQEGMVEAAMAYLEQNYGSEVSVDAIARSAFISPSRLSHVFKQATGMSLMDYLIQIRIDRAQHLLADTDRTVAQICYELGIQSPAYFTRLFKRMIGVSPTEFRDTARVDSGRVPAR